MDSGVEGLTKYKMFIGGEWVDSASGESFESFNPYTAQPWALMPKGNADDIDRAVEAADKAFNEGEWPALTATARGHMIRKFADLITEKADELAEIEVRDNGKLIAEMSAQCKYLTQWYYYYAGLCDKIEGSVIPIDKPGHFNYTVWEPLACVRASRMELAAASACLEARAVTGGWQHRGYQAFRVHVGLYAGIYEDCRTGVPSRRGQCCHWFRAEAGSPLVDHPKVAKVAFTGSDATGSAIYAQAARHMKKVTMELGGKSPNIVFEDAHIDNAVKGVISGIFAATGQTCIAGSRLLVQKSIHDQFVEKLVELGASAKIGDPSSFDTQVGPVTNIPQYQKVLDYIDVAKGEGAEAVLGGGTPSGPEIGEGWFVEPTIFTGVSNDMRIAQEEVFGPVLSVIPFEDEDDAVKTGNDVIYGLAAGVWTQNIGRAITMAEKLRAGTVWVNTYRAVSYLSPFGGYKKSGIGRESGQEMIKEYLQHKSVWIETSNAEAPNPFVLR